MEQPSTLRQQVASSVAAAIAGAGKSNRDISSGAGIPLATLSRCLNGHAPFTVDQIDRLSRFLGAPVSVLIGQEQVQTAADTCGGAA